MKKDNISMGCQVSQSNCSECTHNATILECTLSNTGFKPKDGYGPFFVDSNFELYCFSIVNNHPDPRCVIKKVISYDDKK